MTPEQQKQMLVDYLQGRAPLPPGGQQPSIPTTAGDEGTPYEPMPQQQEVSGYEGIPPHFRNPALLADVLTAGGVTAYQQGVSPVQHAGNTIDRTLKMGSDIAGEVSLAYPTARSANEFAQGNYGQGVREMTPHVLTAATLGVAPAVNAIGHGLKSLSPTVNRAANTVAEMPGFKGAVARQVAGRVPVAGASVGAVEGGKSFVDIAAASAEPSMDAPPQVNFGDPQSVIALQEFLKERGYYNNSIDGVAQPGGPTEQALGQYRAAYQASLPPPPPPETAEERAIRMQREQAQAGLANAEATLKEQEALDRIKARENAESERRKQVLLDAQQRYDGRAKSFSDKTTNALQQWVGPAIMTASALAGARGIPSIPGKRAAVDGVNKLAGDIARRSATPAQKAGYNAAYDDAVNPPMFDSTDKVMYGGLGAEMILSNYKLRGAQQEYDDALAEFETAVNAKDESGQRIPLDGAKEKELADRVIEAKNNVEKWKGLQGAGLHGMGYYTVGKGLSKAAEKAFVPPPNANAKSLRGEFDPKRRSSGLKQIAEEQELQKKVDPSKASALDATALSSGRISSNPASARSKSTSTQKSARFTKNRKEAIAQAYVEKSKSGGKFTEAQARQLAPGVSDEKVSSFVNRLRQSKKKGGIDSILGKVKSGDIKSIAPLGLGAGAAAGTINSEQDRQALANYLRSGN